MKIKGHPGQVTTEEALPALIRQRFDVFLRFAFKEIAGNREFTPGWHIEAIEHQLHRLQEGDIRQLIVTIPPRHLKSITISVAWVAWMLGRDPQTRFTCASYAYDLAEKHARDCLKVIESNWYRKAFPNMRLTKRSLLDFETYAGGGRLSTSVGGVLTGRGGDWIIIDDPMKADDALSETMRDSAGDWFSNTLRQRADDDKTRYIVIMQRLHEDDLAGRLLRQGGWEELRLSAIATQDERIALTRGRFHQRREGKVLTPERQSLAYLLRRKAEEPYVFAAQYQQDPMSRIGAFVMPEWFQTYDIEPQVGTTILSLDTAIKTTVRSDWSVGIVARYYRGAFYVLDIYRERVEFGDLIEAVRDLCVRHRVDHLLIEDAASGHQLIQQLRRESTPGVPPPIAITPTGDKIVRFEAQASRIRAKAVVLPRTAPWLADFIAEVTRFPGGSHDDQADALAQMLANPPLDVRTTNAGPEIILVEDAHYRGSDGYEPNYEDDGWSGL
jgi:predicted phage terminase large subunit-like protein